MQTSNSQIRWQVWLICAAPVTALILGLALKNGNNPRMPAGADPARTMSPHFITSKKSEDRLLAVADLSRVDERVSSSKSAMLNTSDAIAEHVSRLTDEELAGDSAFEIVQRWARVDPTAAANRVARLPANEARSRLLDAVMETWTTKNPRAAIAWVMTLPDPKEQLRLWMNTDYERGIALNEPNTRSNSSVETALNEWLKADAAAASAWVAALPEGTERRAAIEYLAARWSERDAPAATAWIHTLPRETDRQQGFAALLPQLPIKCTHPNP